MSINKKTYVTLVAQEEAHVVGFAVAYSRFIERVTIDQGVGD